MATVLRRSVCVVATVLTMALTGLASAAPVPAAATGEGADRLDSAAAPARAPTVGMVGNSISWQSSAEIRRYVTTSHRLVYFDAVIGATVAAQRPSVVNAVRSAGGPDILLVELGANDASKVSLAQFERDVRLTLNAVTPYVDQVVWFDMKTSGAAIYPAYNRNARRFNATLRQVVGRYPNAVVGHYSVWAAAAGNGAFASDLVHLSPAGERELGRLAKQAADGFDPALRSGPFWDVPDRYWASRAIEWCAAQGIVGGYPDGTFRAYAASVEFTVERGQWLSMLWRQSGSPTGHPPDPWRDTPAWIERAAAWAAANDVFRGFPDGTLRPYAELQRAQAVVTLHRLAGSPDVSELPPHGWSDVPRWVDNAARWAKAAGVFRGYPDGTFRPYGALTRAQAASVIDGFATAPALPSAEAALPPTTAPTTTTTTTLPPVTTEPAPSTTETTTTVPAPVVTTTTLAPTTTTGPAPAPVSRYAGSGDETVEIDKPDGPDRLAILTADHKGGGTFSVVALDRDLNRSALLVHATGGYTGTTLLDPMAGDPTTALQITADGPWQLEIASVDELRSFDSSVAGAGDDVVRYTGATTSAAVGHRGGTRIAVWANTDGREPLVDRIGDYDGAVSLPGSSVLEIRSDGRWSITGG